MRVITVSYAGNVEAVVLANDDEVEVFVEQIKAADEHEDLHVKVHRPDSLASAIAYAQS